jgi:hypothetical protein
MNIFAGVLALEKDKKVSYAGVVHGKVLYTCSDLMSSSTDAGHKMENKSESQCLSKLKSRLTFFERIRLMSSAPLLAGILVISTLNTR